MINTVTVAMQGKYVYHSVKVIMTDTLIPTRLKRSFHSFYYIKSKTPVIKNSDVE